MRFDTSNPGKYIFDSRQKLTTDELLRLEEQYYVGMMQNPSGYYKSIPVINAADIANLAVTYIIIGTVIILPLLLWFVFLKGMEANPKIFTTVGITLAGIGVLLFVKLILRLTVKQRVYSETVDAECIGYARFFESEGGEHSGPGGLPMVSPVFTYRYEGSLYTCCYDGFEVSKDCSVDMGTLKIDICPKHPESVYNSRAQQKDLIILFAVVFLLAGIGFTFAGMMIPG